MLFYLNLDLFYQEKHGRCVHQGGKSEHVLFLYGKTYIETGTLVVHWRNRRHALFFYSLLSRPYTEMAVKVK